MILRLVFEKWPSVYYTKLKKQKQISNRYDIQVLDQMTVTANYMKVRANHHCSQEKN